MVCGGPIIDFFTLLLTPLFEKIGSLPLRILELAVGCVILAYGMTIVIKSDAGTGPNDLVAIVCIGETMALITPTDARLADAAAATIGLAGAESNVAAGAASTGHRVAWASRLGADPLGDRVATGYFFFHRHSRQPQLMLTRAGGQGGLEGRARWLLETEDAGGTITVAARPA